MSGPGGSSTKGRLRCAAGEPDPSERRRHQLATTLDEGVHGRFFPPAHRGRGEAAGEYTLRSMSALYRRYRPRDFSEVVGQRPIVRTLANAIETGRVRHAYLFSGPRGTGKTSLAKILAKSLNCLSSPGPTVTPCLTCASCVSIHDATALDVIELDAASNRGIDDIREIRERVAVHPVQGRKKVYILDEAHSLTADASNALLKTLEEPPEHVVFVLCTTEPHRLLDTIRGRCQSFAFQRPTIADATEALDRVVAAESIEIDRDALTLIARAGKGSFRDAISTLDQVVTAVGGPVAATDVRSVLGLADESSIGRLIDLIAAQDAPAALALVEDAVEEGQDLGQFVSDSLTYLRLVFLTAHLGELPPSAGLTDEEAQALRNRAAATPERMLTQLVEGLLAVQDELREGGDPRLPLELLLVRITRPAADRSREAILRRLDQLEAGARPPRRPERALSLVPEPEPMLEPKPVSELPPLEQPSTGPSGRTAAVSAPPEPPSVTASPEEPVATEAAPPSAPGPRLGSEIDPVELGRIWREELVPIIEQKRPPLAPSLLVGRPVGIDEGAVIVEFSPSRAFQMSQADAQTNRALTADELGALLGERVRIVYRMASEAQPPLEPQAAAPPVEDLDPVSREHAFIQHARTTFDVPEDPEEYP